MESGRKMNDEIESQTKNEAQIHSLQVQNTELSQELSSEKQRIFQIEQDLEEIKLRHKQ